MDTKIVFHVSITEGISNSVNNTLKIGCNAFQIFSRSPRGWSAKPLLENDIKNFRIKLNDSKIDPECLFVHMPYLPNLSFHGVSRLHKKSTDTLIEELRRSSILGIPYVILHLGSHGGKGTDNGIDQLLKACKIAFRNYYRPSSLPSALGTTAVKNNKKKSEGKSTKQDKSVTMILENSVGEKNSIGSKFDELGLILDKLTSSSSSSSTHSNTKNASSYGVCLDTCHAFAAGYDLRT